MISFKRYFTFSERPLVAKNTSTSLFIPNPADVVTKNGVMGISFAEQSPRREKQIPNALNLRLCDKLNCVGYDSDKFNTINLNINYKCLTLFTVLLLSNNYVYSDQKTIICTNEYPFRKYNIEKNLPKTDVLTHCGKPLTVTEKEISREEIWSYKNFSIIFKDGHVSGENFINEKQPEKAEVKIYKTKNLKSDTYVSEDKPDIRELLNDIAVNESSEESQVNSMQPPS